MENLSEDLNWWLSQIESRFNINAIILPKEAKDINVNNPEFRRGIEKLCNLINYEVIFFGRRDNMAMQIFKETVEKIQGKIDSIEKE